jgi:hypothetical protein
LLSKYDFEITYIKGTMNIMEDALSWRPHIFLVMPQMNLHENIRTIQCDEHWYKEVKENIGQDTMLVPKFEGFTVDIGGLMRYNN